MTLANLLKIGRLKTHASNGAEIRRLLAAAARNLADAWVEVVSDETRFDAAYKTIMQVALAAMLASGYRPSTSEPGHHQTLIQSLPLTVGLASDAWVVIDALRRKRNAADYLGDPVEAEALAECVRQAEYLYVAVETWLRERHPSLLNEDR
ncbi:MAG: DNA-binding protein [Rhodocyclales bacterium RIFCSPLOWO2_02_FULL_63_24]|nr:MAG: DNA-binding protein [Rhodocyclales bacterium GWA2_65_19]OHC68736.1 MAG: DNA-binding protein [Rhodocyclales bacterium RIFCSPLOWO2_02_FULL_63_24]